MTTIAVSPTGDRQTITLAAYRQALSSKLFGNESFVLVRRGKDETPEDAARRGQQVNPNVYIIVETDEGSGDDAELPAAGDTSLPPLKSLVPDDFAVENAAQQRAPIRKLGESATLLLRTNVGLTADMGMYDMHVMARTKKFFFSLRPVFQIKRFTTMREFYSNRADLIADIQRLYDVMLIEPKTRMHDVWGTKVPAYSEMGFDLQSAYHAVDDVASGRAIHDMIRVLTMGRAGAKNDVETQCISVIPENAFELLAMGRTRQWARLAPWRSVYDVLEHFESALYIRDVPPLLHQEQIYVRTLARPRLRGAFLRFVMRNPLVMAFEARRVRDLFHDMVVIDSTDAALTYREIAEQLRISVTRASRESHVPQALTRSNGQAFFRDLFSVLAAPTMLCLRWPTIWDKLELKSDRFIELIMLKLMTPSYVWAERSITDIDNEILFYLESYLRANGAVIFSMDMARNRGVNLLSQALNANAWRMPARALDFLRSDGQGGGWATTSNYALEQIPNALAAFLGVGGLAFSPVCSHINAQPHARTEPGDQFRNFIEFANWLGNTQRARARSDDLRVVNSVFEMVIRSDQTVSNYGATMSELLRQVTRLALYPPVTPQDVLPNRLEIDLQAMPFSCLMLTNWPQVRLGTPDMWSIVNYAAGRDHWTQALTDAHWFVTRFYPQTHFKKSERLKLIKSRMTIDLGWNEAIFDQAIIERRAMEFIELPPTTDVDPNYAAMCEYIDSMVNAKPEMFGYANSFVYKGRRLREADSRGKMAFFMSTDPDRVELQLTTDELVQHTVRGTLTPLFREAEANGESIRIMHPIYLIKVETKDVPVQPTPLSAITTDADYPVGPLYYYYTLSDDFRDENGPVAFLRTEPSWVIDEIPFNLGDLDVLQAMPRQVQATKDALSVVNNFAFKLRMQLF